MSRDSNILISTISQGRRRPQTQHSMASALLTLVQKYVQAPGSTAGAGAGAGALATGGGGGVGRGRFGGGGASSAGVQTPLPTVTSW